MAGNVVGYATSSLPSSLCGMVAYSTASRYWARVRASMICCDGSDAARVSAGWRKPTLRSSPSATMAPRPYREARERERARSLHGEEIIGACQMATKRTASPGSLCASERRRISSATGSDILRLDPGEFIHLCLNFDNFGIRWILSKTLMFPVPGTLRRNWPDAHRS
jgi:hypothetical protein